MMEGIPPKDVLTPKSHIDVDSFVPDQSLSDAADG